MLTTRIMAIAFMAIAISPASYAGGLVGSVTLQNPSIAPTGDQIVFGADLDGGGRIWRSSTNGSGLRVVKPTGGTTVAEGQPAWAPDGQEIAYVGLSEQGAQDIWAMRADGAYPRRITNGLGRASSPSWSPDSKRIVFISDKDGTKDIWIINRDGSGATKLLNSQKQENNPSFSPAGDKIVFSQTEGASAALAIINSDGSGLTSLTPPGPFQDWSPYWGSSGIVFTSNRDGSGRWKLHVVQPDGRGLMRIGDTPGQDPVAGKDGRVFYVDESIPGSKAVSGIGSVDQAGVRRVVVDVQGYLMPIAIRPKSMVNRINPASAGRIKVAVLSSSTFSAPANVDQRTLTFGSVGNEPSLVRCAKHGVDVNGDGLLDLTCRFAIRAAAFRQGDQIGILRFSDKTGVSYEGREPIVVVPSRDELEDFAED